MSPRTGRPTDNPKPYKISTRIDEKCKSILDRYCEQKKYLKWRQYGGQSNCWKNA